MRNLEAELLFGEELYRAVVIDKMARARESVWIATANVKEMYVDAPSQSAAKVGTSRARSRDFRSIIDLFGELRGRGVELRILHAEVPSRPFRAAFDRKRKLWSGGLELKICPRVHFKAVIVDGGWLYLGSANLTGAGLGARGADKRNFEIGIGTEDFDAIDRTTALFEAVWSGAECGPCQLRAVCPDPLGPPSRATRKPRKKSDEGSLVQLGRARRIQLPR